MQALPEQTPPDASARWEMLGFLHTLRGELDAAAEAFKSAAVLSGLRDAATLCLLGSAESQRGAHAAGETAFQHATLCAAGTEGMRAWTGLGRCQAAQGARSRFSVQSSHGRRQCRTSLWHEQLLHLARGPWWSSSLNGQPLQTRMQSGFWARLRRTAVRGVLQASLMTRCSRTARRWRCCQTRRRCGTAWRWR